MSQSLPAKDQAVFRSIVKYYEQKQYKKGSSGTSRATFQGDLGCEKRMSSVFLGGPA